ncbi:tyrosine-type recombinase/integrase [Clostridium scatologenes]|uniref:Phage integrase, N-terminal SAM domain protein n=1 Tax=Clostridium scatologenes TaxID=1548 RepID=A0A0E3GS05_CLOSL|nr:site-specific integrase [Clostridium scatologenes]AKA71231.1 phage integrase, N-terminal SAM domain protein [Clostridium scatologenes]
MPKTRVKFNNSNGVTPNTFMQNFGKSNINITQFTLLHEKFMEAKTLEGLAPRTLEDHVKHFKFFKKYIETIQRTELDQIFLSKDLFKNYVAYMLLEKKYAPCTINLRITSLKCYLNWLFKEKYTTENYSLYLVRVKRPQDTILPLTKEEVKKMLNVVDTGTYAGIRDFTMMIIILDCGIRPQELCNVKINEVDFKNKLLKVNAQTAKTRKSRELPLSKQSLHLLKQLISISEENQSPYIFMSSQTADKLDHNVAAKNFEKYGKRAGIKKRCTPYVFRHTFATNAVKKGMDTFTLQRIMGHALITTTRQYVQLDTRDLVRSHEKTNFLNEYFK